MREFWLIATAALLSGCAQSSVLPLSSDTVQITSSAAPICGATGAQQVALQNAAIETLRNGFDKFFITNAQAQNNVGVIGRTPMSAQTDGIVNTVGGPGFASSTFSGNTTFYGGYPIVAGTHDQVLVVRMLKYSDAGATDAISARKVLGKDWQEKVENGSGTTCS